MIKAYIDFWKRAFDFRGRFDPSRLLVGLLG